MSKRIGRWRGEAVKYVSPRGSSDVWFRAGDFHDVQGPQEISAHQQDEYTVAAVFR
jgi:hypothetical protein